MELPPSTFSKLPKGERKKKPLKRRKVRKRNSKIIAYDLETTSIASGTPELKYITAYGEGGLIASEKIESVKDLSNLLYDKLLTDDNNRARFVAWNANRFDVYFIGRALLHNPNAVIRPFLTRSKSLRGLRVDLNGNSYQFLDGLAMTGITKPLKDFIKTFSPDHAKLSLNLDVTEFNADNSYHVQYAERDSEGLYYAIKHADSIAEKLTGTGLTPTVGNLAIKYMASQMPENVTVWAPTVDAENAIRKSALRGGYCFSAKAYRGPSYKYDLNQAYAAAMRDCKLPSGRIIKTDTYNRGDVGIYYIRHANKSHDVASGRVERSLTPVAFYYRNLKGESVFDGETITDTYLTSDEIEQLENEGWNLDIPSGWKWSDSFNLKEMVDNLEQLRYTDADGPSGPLGTMVKALGNNAFGKTLEQLDGVEIVMANECPDGFYPYDPTDETLDSIFFRMNEPFPREYHQPQIGTFITAYNRMVVRRAILHAPESFIYADTDCIVFDRPIDTLDIDPKRYGAWKQESDGEEFIFITKKVYASVDTGSIHAKGLNVNRLTIKDVEKWYHGLPPTQTQIQRNNWVKFMSGHNMFKERVKVGQRL